MSVFHFDVLKVNIFLSADIFLTKSVISYVDFL